MTFSKFILLVGPLALREVLDKADGNLNGKVGLKEFIQILEVNGVEVSSE